jgi:hypothetical protein
MFRFVGIFASTLVEKHGASGEAGVALLFGTIKRVDRG